MKESDIFEAHWPEALKPGQVYRMLCDDKGINEGSWLKVFVASDGDAHVVMQDWEDITEKDSHPNSIPSIRIRTYSGGGRNRRTHQALLWLAEAIRLDNEENGCPNE